MRGLTAALAALLAGAALLTSSRAASGPAVPPGRKAVSLPLDAYKWHYLKPGYRVDVLGTFEDSTELGTPDWQTGTLIQDVLVLEVKRPGRRSSRSAVALALTKTESDLLSRARRDRMIFTILVRGRNDHDRHPLETASYRKLFR